LNEFCKPVEYKAPPGKNRLSRIHDTDYYEDPIEADEDPVEVIKKGTKALLALVCQSVFGSQLMASVNAAGKQDALMAISSPLSFSPNPAKISLETWILSAIRNRFVLGRFESLQLFASTFFRLREEGFGYVGKLYVLFENYYGIQDLHNLVAMLEDSEATQMWAVIGDVIPEVESNAHCDLISIYYKELMGFRWRDPLSLGPRIYQSERALLLQTAIALLGRSKPPEDEFDYPMDH
jgi:hypothetical protein